VAEDKIPKIAQAIRGVAYEFSTFTVSIGEMGVFPHPRSPRVIWVSAKSVGDDLTQLHGEIEKVLMPLGFSPEDRPFHPHLTLGRIKSGDRRRDLGFDKTGLMQWLFENHKREYGRFEVKEVLLVKSDLQPSGAVYTPLARMKFGG
jgi:2'-5' RNA ligase